MSIGAYLRSLKWPDNVKDAVDVASKTIIAVLVGAVSLAYHHYQEAQLQLANDRAAADAKLQRDLAQDREQREDARATYGFFVTGMPDSFTSDGAIARLEIMIAFCNDPLNARETIVATACKHLPAEPISASQRKEAQVQAATAPTAYVNSPLAQRSNIATAAAEAAAPPTLGAHWFAVVGTVPLANPDTAKSLSASVAAQLRAAGISNPVILYRTKISQSFALTLGGPLSQADATALANRVRASGVIRDAFAQPDRNWVAAGL